MSNEITKICDYCGKRAVAGDRERDLPDGWMELDLRSSDRGFMYVGHHDLCPECVESNPALQRFSLKAQTERARAILDQAPACPDAEEGERMGRLIILSCDRCGKEHPVHPDDPFRIPEGWMRINAESVFVGAHGYAQQELCPACIAHDAFIKTVYDRTREFAVEGDE